MKNKNRFITGYSGLRSLAVIGVILYHLNPNVFIGGYLGVLIFFVLSGYLVTDHMLFSYQTYGKYSNRLFYLKRIKKLYPQLISVLWISGAYILIFQRDILSKFNEIVLANLFNVYNIWQIFNGQSYFERFASNESPFVHLWTMSILGQFYLLWPIIMYILVYKLRTKKELFITISVLTILSAIEMALLYKPGVDTSRIYYGTDTRFFALGIGALLAIVCPTNRLRIGIKKNNTILLDSLGAVSFIGMFILATNQCMNPMQAFPYMGGMFIFSILTAIMVAIIANPHSHWNLVLTNPIFNWIGSRSYGIYLYQFPIMIFFESQAKNLAYNVFFYRVSEIILILLIS
ncbi:MAG: acyltransferase, partial [Lactobacillus iners]|nr:acyltransferase [Lactobacillus iners]